jgi:hypothetical protein
MPKVVFSGRHYNPTQFRVGKDTAWSEAGPVNWSEVRQRYALVRNGQFATGHFPADPEFIRVLRDLGLRTVVIFRDPRDIAVSTAFYIRSLRRHPLHHVYAGFTSVSEAIDATITGIQPGPDHHGIPSIGERMREYVPWLECPGVLNVRFEDLVGEPGGGSRGAQLTAVAEIARHIGRPLEGVRLQRVCDKVFAPRSATFRKGQIGDWKNHFSPERVELFKATAGDALITLGYESGHDW